MTPLDNIINPMILHCESRGAMLKDKRIHEDEFCLGCDYGLVCEQIRHNGYPAEFTPGEIKKFLNEVDG